MMRRAARSPAGGGDGVEQSGLAVAAVRHRRPSDPAVRDSGPPRGERVGVENIADRHHLPSPRAARSWRELGVVAVTGVTLPAVPVDCWTTQQPVQTPAPAGQRHEHISGMLGETRTQPFAPSKPSHRPEIIICHPGATEHYRRCNDDGESTQCLSIVPPDRCAAACPHSKSVDPHRNRSLRYLWARPGRMAGCCEYASIARHALRGPRRT